MRSFWRRKQDDWQRPPPPEEVRLQAIAFVRNDVVKPRPYAWEKVESTLEFLPEHEARLDGIEAFSHLIVVTYLDVAEGAPEKPEHLTLESGKTFGILATRSQLRPNHLGISVVELRSHEGCTLHVRGLDAIDATPILDVKPYLPQYDAIHDARLPQV